MRKRNWLVLTDIDGKWVTWGCYASLAAACLEWLMLKLIGSEANRSYSYRIHHRKGTETYP